MHIGNTKVLSLHFIILGAVTVVFSCGNRSETTTTSENNTPALPAPKEFTMDNYEKAVKSGFRLLPESIEIEQLFGEADHFISHHGPKLPREWNTEVFFGGGYCLTMQVDVQTNAESNSITSTVGKKAFYLNEISKVTILATGQVETRFSNDWKFGLDDWKKLVAAKGNFEVIGITIRKNKPVENFDAYVKGQREPRVRVRPE